MPVIITHTTVEPNLLSSLQSSTEGLDFLHSDLTLFHRYSSFEMPMWTLHENEATT